jgi:hypothetical protein
VSTINYAAFGEGPEVHGLLSGRVRDRWAEIGGRLATTWQSGDKVLAERLSGCLDKLSASLVQVKRLREHHDSVVQRAEHRPPGAQYAAFRGAPVCAEFEGLLLQGRACLDRLSWLISTRLGQQCSSFRGLGNVLGNFRSHESAMSLLEVVNAVEPSIDAVYAQIDAPHSLRDMVGHREALTERMRTCLGIWWFGEGRAIVLDCEVQISNAAPAIALFEASAQSVQDLSTAVLESSAVLLALDRLGHEAYRSTWTSQTVALSRYFTTDSEPLRPDALHFAKRMTPSGFVVESRNIDRSIRDRAIVVRS